MFNTYNKPIIDFCSDVTKKCIHHSMLLGLFANFAELSTSEKLSAIVKWIRFLNDLVLKATRSLNQKSKKVHSLHDLILESDYLSTQVPKCWIIYDKLMNVSTTLTDKSLQTSWEFLAVSELMEETNNWLTGSDNKSLTDVEIYLKYKPIVNQLKCLDDHEKWHNLDFDTDIQVLFINASHKLESLYKCNCRPSHNFEFAFMPPYSFPEERLDIIEKIVWGTPFGLAPARNAPCISTGGTALNSFYIGEIHMKITEEKNNLSTLMYDHKRI